MCMKKPRPHPMKIYVDLGMQPDEAAALARLTAQDEVWIAKAAQPAADRQAFLEAEIVFGGFPAELLGAATRLRWIQLSSVGIDNFLQIDWAALQGRVTCTNMRGVFAEAMAQSVLGYILALNRGLD